MKISRIIIFLIVFILQSSALGSQVTPVIEDPIEFSNSRLSALGGYHAALSDDIMTIFNNPAGFSLIDSSLLISELTVGLSGPIFDITGVVIQSMSDPAGMMSLMTLLSSIYASIDLVGPVSFAYAGKGISFGIFNWADMTFEAASLSLSSKIQENMLISGGYSLQIPLNNQSINIGLQLKVLLRGTINPVNGILDVFSSLDNPLSLIEDTFKLSLGGGVDMGIIYSLADILDVGIVARNLYTGTLISEYTTVFAFLNGEAVIAEKQGIIPLDLSGGIKISPPLGFLDRFITDLKILIDYQDILDFVTHPLTQKHWLLHLSMGLELKLLENLSLRGGFSQNLFAAGLGLDIGVFKINASMFGSELSNMPGIRPLYNMVIGFEFIL